MKWYLFICDMLFAGNPANSIAKTGIDIFTGIARSRLLLGVALLEALEALETSDPKFEAALRWAAVEGLNEGSLQRAEFPLEIEVGSGRWFAHDRGGHWRLLQTLLQEEIFSSEKEEKKESRAKLYCFALTGTRATSGLEYLVARRDLLKRLHAAKPQFKTWDVEDALASLEEADVTPTSDGGCSTAAKDSISFVNRVARRNGIEISIPSYGASAKCAAMMEAALLKKKGQLLELADYLHPSPGATGADEAQMC